MNGNRIWVRWVGWVRLGVGLLGWGWEPSRGVFASENRKPSIGVRFAIEAPAYANPLRGKRPGLEAEIAAQIAALCSNELSYLEWRVLTNAPSPRDPSWVLEGTMLSEGNQLFPSCFLVFKGSRSTGAPIPLLRSSLYPGSIPGPTQDEATFRRDLTSCVRTTFENTDNVRRLQTRFLIALPVATNLSAVVEHKRIQLPALWGDMLPGEGSRLRVLYEVAQPDGGRLGAKLRLSPSVPEPTQQRVTCTVMLFDYPPVTENAWHPLMPESLQKAVPETVRVYMEEYEKDYNYVPRSSAGVVFEPTPGGTTGGQP